MALQWAGADAGRTWGLDEPESQLLVLQSCHVASTEIRPSCMPAREGVDFLRVQVCQQRPGASTGGDPKTRDTRITGANRRNQ